MAGSRAKIEKRGWSPDRAVHMRGIPQFRDTVVTLLAIAKFTESPMEEKALDSPNTSLSSENGSEKGFSVSAGAPHTSEIVSSTSMAKRPATHLSRLPFELLCLTFEMLAYADMDWAEPLLQAAMAHDGKLLFACLNKLKEKHPNDYWQALFVEAPAVEELRGHRLREWNRTSIIREFTFSGDTGYLRKVFEEIPAPYVYLFDERFLEVCNFGTEYGAPLADLRCVWRGYDIYIKDYDKLDEAQRDAYFIGEIGEKTQKHPFVLQYYFNYLDEREDLAWTLGRFDNNLKRKVPNIPPFLERLGRTSALSKRRGDAANVLPYLDKDGAISSRETLGFFTYQKEKDIKILRAQAEARVAARKEDSTPAPLLLRAGR